MKLSQVVAIGLTSSVVAAVAFLSSDQSRAVETAVAAVDEGVAVENCAPTPALVCDAFELGGRGHTRYRRVEVAAETCTQQKVLRDGGVAATATDTRIIRPRANVEIVPGSCVPAAVAPGPRAADGGVAFLAQACACRRATGTCQYRNDAGTLVTAPLGRTLGPGYPPFESWAGAGCQNKACTELAGESSWPSTCPRR